MTQVSRDGARWEGTTSDLQPGDVVTGSDGKQYRYSNIARRDADVYPMKTVDGEIARNRNGGVYWFVEPYEFFAQAEPEGTPILVTRRFGGTHGDPEHFRTVRVAYSWGELASAGWGNTPDEIRRNWYEAHSERLEERMPNEGEYIVE